MNLARATPETAWAIPEPPPPPVRMAPNANPAFEVATIKPSDPAKREQIITLRGVEVITTNTTLHDLINLAYWLHPKQLTGGPAWTESDRFDLTGKPDAPGQPNVDQMKMMIQKLLADRFQLKFHFEKRDLPVYAITIAKTGAKNYQEPGRSEGHSRMEFLEEIHRERWYLASRNSATIAIRRPVYAKTRCRIDPWWTSQAFPKGTISR